MIRWLLQWESGTDQFSMILNDQLCMGIDETILCATVFLIRNCHQRALAVLFERLHPHPCFNVRVGEHHILVKWVIELRTAQNESMSSNIGCDMTCGGGDRFRVWQGTRERVGALPRHRGPPPPRTSWWCPPLPRRPEAQTQPLLHTQPTNKSHHNIEMVNIQFKCK